MSTFGDNTPQQIMLDWISYTQTTFSLTDEEVAIILAKIISFFLDPYDRKFDDGIRRKKK